MDDNQLLEELAKSMAPDTSPSETPQPGVPVQRITEIGEDTDAIVMSDDEISGIITGHISRAIDWVGSEIAHKQAEAMRYYLGEAVGDLAPPDTEDRSDIVDTTVSDQIEWIMPSLMEIFFASGNVVRFNPRKAGDEQGAEQMTALANYVINDENPGFQIFEDWFKVALLNKVGVVKAWWEQETTRTREVYDGMTDAQLAILSNNPDVTITKCVSYIDPAAERAAMDQFDAQKRAYEQAQQAQRLNPAVPHPNVAAGAMLNAGAVMPSQAPMMGHGAPASVSPMPAPSQAPIQPPAPIDLSQLPQLHNVILTVSKKCGRVAFEALNPEDFLIDEHSRRIEDGFSAHRMKKTISELRAAGYPNVDDISSDRDAVAAEMSAVELARLSQQSLFSTVDGFDSYGDESQREVWLYECYLPIDCDGDGISEWRKITRAGDRILENVVCDGPPFAALCPVSIPGLFYGRSIADLAMPIQKIKTGVLRSLQDNMNLQVNGRTWAIENQVNLDDLLTNRPGGVVRVKNANAVGALQQGMADSAGAYQLLQYVDTMSQERTGVTKYSQGLDSDTLNHTATGIENITQRADLRVKLIARTFAETGVKALFRLIQKILMNYQDQAMTFQLNGSWVDVDPRVWKNQYTMKADVGLGTGDRGRRVAQLMQLLGIQQQGMEIGLATPANLYHTATELVAALQLGSPQQYFTLPTPQAPQPPKPDPQMLLVQGQLQIENAKVQGQQQIDSAKIQAQMVADEREAQLKAQLANQHETLLDQRERDATQLQIAADRAQQQEQQAWEREKFYAQLAATREGNALKAGVTSPAVEIGMNRAIQGDQQSTEAATIDREFALASQLLGQRVQ